MSSSIRAALAESQAPITAPAADGRPDPEVLREVEQRILWLATAIVDHANRVRPNPSGLKVGGHQASSASMVTIMTALWFHELRPEDRISVKPHASPVLHAIEYLLGLLDESYLTTLRKFGGLQSYPSRLKDPVAADYSTGSVGIGATAPIWGAIARRYVEGHLGSGGQGRQYSLVGDAELDEGAVWEALQDPLVSGLGEVVWIVDLNRQSLDRVVPARAADRLRGMFEATGWQVLTVKYGSLLEGLFRRPGGEDLRARIDAMGNAEYQRLLRLDEAGLRDRLPGNGPGAEVIAKLLGGLDGPELMATVRNLGGHDFESLLDAFDDIDDSRPSVILAYTIKGYHLPTEGHPQNHSSLLSEDQMRDLGVQLGMSLDAPWERFLPTSPAGQLCAAAAAAQSRATGLSVSPVDVPTDLGRTPTGIASTQAALGRSLLDLNRAAPAVGARVVTVSPDVSTSTNLAGWVNKVGVWSPEERIDWFTDDPETLVHWREGPHGRHIELGIAEGNLVGLLSELGATWNRWNEPLLPIGVLYDPFVERALEPWSFGMYAGGQSILVGTPSGVTLAAEGGAHQSITTPSVGLEQPGCTTWEPAFAIDAEWCLLAALGNLGRASGQSAYLRLSTRPVDQALAEVPVDGAARERRRRNVVEGAYTLKRHPDAAVTLVSMGAIVPEALEAARRLSGLGFEADVVCVTSPGLVFEAAQSKRGLSEAPTRIVESVFPETRALPMVTSLDGHPHTLAFLAGLRRVPATHLGVSKFGQSGDLADVYRYHGIDAVAIVEAALDLID
jgi:pyruvate dehydrogenase E1 component